ncbi:tetratricopeptide repeat protein [Flavobacterium sp. RHBU_3]|uniref:tetratricopeptide repeat protein n=1 Tax=Flavobacterium sp. RHBU_3 TaxID=3391184 RepID=UPI003985589C
MKKIYFLLFLFSLSINSQEKPNEKIKNLEETVQELKNENEILKNNYNNLSVNYQHTNDRLNNYLTYTGFIASIFGIIIAVAGIYIGFESLKSQNRQKSAIKTLEEAKSYVNGKKNDFDILIEDKKTLLQQEYDKITTLFKDKLLSDIEIETSKVKELAERKTEEIQNVSIDSSNKTIELLEKRLEFFENVSIPDDPKILFSKAQILRDKKMHSDAISLLEKVIMKEPMHNEAYWYLGFEYAELKYHDKSIQNYLKALEISPKSSSAYNNIALQYAIKDNPLEALNNFDKAIDIDNKKELYYNNRIEVLKKLKSNERVIADYLKLIIINPTNEDYYIKLIQLFEGEKKFSDAIEYSNKAIEQFQMDNEKVNNFKYIKALLLENNGRESEAVDILQNLIDNSYKIENCYFKIADLKSKLGQIEEAISILDNGLLNNSLSSNLYIYKAFIQSQESINSAKETIDQGGQKINTESFYFLAARFFSNKERRELANYCYEGVLKMIEQKISINKAEEGDFLNYYETKIILEKSVTDFNDNFRVRITSEKYQTVLNILDIIIELLEKFDNIEKIKAIEKIKNLNLEAKDKSLYSWNFTDLLSYIKEKNNNNLFLFVKNIDLYMSQTIRIEEL